LGFGALELGLSFVLVLGPGPHWREEAEGLWVEFEGWVGCLMGVQTWDREQEKEPAEQKAPEIEVEPEEP
jgi:hypothetical protein